MAIPSSVSSYLERNGVHYSVLAHKVAYTAQEDAAATHVPGREWAKAVVCMVDEEPVLAVLPATSVVNLDRVRRLLGAATIRLASEPELQSLYEDCELGAMPPLGPLYGQPVLVDTRLTYDAEIAFNAGSHREAIRMRYSDFESLVKPKVADFGVPPQVH